MGDCPGPGVKEGVATGSNSSPLTARFSVCSCELSIIVLASLVAAALICLGAPCIKHVSQNSQPQARLASKSFGCVERQGYQEEL